MTERAGDLRAEIRDLLNAWRRSDLEPWDVVERAEALAEGDGPRATTTQAVLDLLELANHQWVLPRDIPFLLEILDEQDTEAGMRRLDAYWERELTVEREAAAEQLYYGPKNSEASG